MDGEVEDTGSNLIFVFLHRFWSLVYERTCETDVHTCVDRVKNSFNFRSSVDKKPYARIYMVSDRQYIVSNINT